MNNLRILLVFPLITMVTGCMFYQLVTITTKPSNADIYINNNYKGKAPWSEQLLTEGFATTEAHKRHVIVAKMDGYADEIVVLQSPSFFMSNLKPFPDNLNLILKKNNKYNQGNNQSYTQNYNQSYIQGYNQSNIQQHTPKKTLNIKNHKGPKVIIAVIDFTSKDTPQSLALNISELIRTQIINTGKYIVIERSQMREILKEQGFQQTGCTDTSCAVQIGKLLSAKKILIGSVMKLGSKLIITGRVVDVEKGVGERGATGQANTIDELDSGVIDFINNLSEL